MYANNWNLNQCLCLLLLRGALPSSDCFLHRFVLEVDTCFDIGVWVCVGVAGWLFNISNGWFSLGEAIFAELGSIPLRSLSTGMWLSTESHLGVVDVCFLLLAAVLMP